jgi:hypothetical protein
MRGGVGSADTRVIISRPLFMGCIGARGYVVDPRGPLAAPAESVVYFGD